MLFLEEIAVQLAIYLGIFGTLIIVNINNENNKTVIKE
jgi:hypothetical protein